MTDKDRMADDPRDHYAAQMTNTPPTEIVCCCGERFVGGDVIAKQKAHMDRENQQEEGQ